MANRRNTQKPPPRKSPGWTGATQDDLRNVERAVAACMAALERVENQQAILERAVVGIIEDVQYLAGLADEEFEWHGPVPEDPAQEAWSSEALENQFHEEHPDALDLEPAEPETPEEKEARLAEARAKREAYAAEQRQQVERMNEGV